MLLQNKAVLSPRLSCAAAFVRKGSVIADIGTDHAFLPVSLVLDGTAVRALACDLRKGPLNNARKTVEEYGLSDRIELRLSDGLDSISEDEADDFIFCGMGGTLIAEILERTGWIKNSRYRFIFQPQSHSVDLRTYLIENLFEIREESVCTDAGRDYTAFYAEYTGIRKEYPDYYPYFGNIMDKGCEASERIAKRTLEYLKVREESELKFGTEESAEEFANIIKHAREKYDEIYGK